MAAQKRQHFKGDLKGEWASVGHRMVGRVVLGLGSEGLYLSLPLQLLPVL